MPVHIMRADLPNGNGRIYPMAALEHCVKRAEAGPIYGELGVPEGTSVNLNKVSHTVDNLRIEGDLLVGDITILHTPQGEQLSKILSACVFRPTGTGVIRNGIVTDYHLISIDAVVDGAEL